MKKVMILGGSILQLPVIEKAKRLGFDTIVVDYDNCAIGRKIANRFYNVSTLDIDSVTQIAERENIDGILTIASDKPMLTVASISDKLGLHSINLDTAKKTVNKNRMREELAKKNVPIPKFIELKRESDYVEFMTDFDKIVKPVSNSGSRGVSFISKHASKDEMNKAINYARSFSQNGTVLVEEFMTGPEVSVETISVKGKIHILAVTDKITTGKPYFVETGHTQPSSLREHLEKIKLVASQAVEALGIQTGPSHVEIIVTKDGPKIVEVGARLGGDQIGAKLTKFSTGIDLVEKTLRQSVGEEIEIEELESKSSAIRYLMPSAGIIESIENIEQANSLPGVVEILITKNSSERVNEIQNSNDRIGYIIVKGNELSEVLKICDQALTTLNIKIKNARI